MKEKVFLTSTDTTIGFLSQSKTALDRAKKRAPNKHYIRVYPNLASMPKRVPKQFKSRIRRAQKSTFILSKSFSFRISHNQKHNLLLKRLDWAYTSSANESNKAYDYNYAYNQADIIVYPLKLGKVSNIYKLSKSKIKKIR